MNKETLENIEYKIPGSAPIELADFDNWAPDAGSGRRTPAPNSRVQFCAYAMLFQLIAEESKCNRQRHWKLSTFVLHP
jgi:hypothetical protein